MEDELKNFRLSDKVKAKLKDKAWIREELARGKSVQEILGFSAEAMEAFYHVALKLIENQRYKDSIDAFSFLSTLNPERGDYWMGLGIAAQLSQDFDTAINAYELAAYCDMENPAPYFYLAKCLFAIHDRKSALDAILLAIDYCGENHNYAELKKQAIAAKETLLKIENRGE